MTSPNDFITLAREYVAAGEAMYQLGLRTRPVAFAYLHSVESLLKGLLYQENALSEALGKTHNLVELWQALDRPQPDLTEIITHISTIDPKTTRSRYPKDPPFSCNLAQVREWTLLLHNLLDVLDKN